MDNIVQDNQKMKYSETDRVIGRLEQFHKETEKRLSLIEDKLDKLFVFKWQIVGGAAVISIFFSGAVEVISLLIK